MTDLIPEVLGPVLTPPTRRPRSVRRTSTMLMSWPDGPLSGLRLLGRARDLLTTEDGDAVAVDEHAMVASTSLDRTVTSLTAEPPVEGLDGIVGARAGGRLRGALAESVPHLETGGAALHLLLDDLAGSSLIAGFAWFRWRDELPELGDLRTRIPVRSMQGICSGFRPGASSLNPDGSQSDIPHQVAPVPPLVDPDDPIGWHEQPDHPAMAMRRARRIDVWREGSTWHVDAMFRDSCWEPGGTEVAVHEYQIDATADAESGVLTSVEAHPRVLPYDECPLAASNVGLVDGVALADLRTEVLARIRDTDCCTHLNDALRSLAEVPVLAASVPMS